MKNRHFIDQFQDKFLCSFYADFCCSPSTSQDNDNQASSLINSNDILNKMIIIKNLKLLIDSMMTTVMTYQLVRKLSSFPSH